MKKRTGGYEGTTGSRAYRVIESARQQSKETRRQVVVTVVINPDAPDQCFTGTIAGTFDLYHQND